jgi:magnesium-transporting ATPase (P-type)
MIQCEKENDNIYGFAGFIKFEDRELQVPVDIDQILLRGSSLRNTEWVYALSVYTGHDTKVMMNSARSRPKSSKLERQMNKYIVISMFIQTTVCLVAACAGVIWLNAGSNEENYYYLSLHASTFTLAEDILI